MKKNIIRTETNPSAFHSIMSGMYRFISENNYFPTIALMSYKQYHKTIDDFSIECRLNTAEQQPVGNSFEYQMDNAKIRVIICHAIPEGLIEFH